MSEVEKRQNNGEDHGDAGGKDRQRKRRRWDTGGPEDAKKTTAADNAMVAGEIAQALEKAKQAALIQRQIQQRLQSLNLPTPRTTPMMAFLPNYNPFLSNDGAFDRGSKVAKKFILDESGRLVDETGHEIQVDRQVSTLKVNINKEEIVRAPVVERFVDKVGEVKPPEDESQRFLDPRIESAPVERKAREFRFVKQGKFVKQGQTLRMKQLSREMKQRVRTAMIEGNLESLGQGSLFKVQRALEKEQIPDVEWWDSPLLDAQDMDEQSYSDCKLLEHKISAIEHHPIALAPAAEPPPPPPMPLMLTKEERRKIKRRKKMEDQKEKTDLIRFGLMPAPEPKMTLKNLKNIMKAMEQDAVANPSAIEDKIKKQMAERKAKHEAQNEANKLTPEQRREKKRRKLMEDTSVEVHVCLFRAGDLRPPQTRFKVDVSANQYNLTGCAIMFEGCNLVLVEGGPKGIKKFSRLMMNRIKWSSASAAHAAAVASGTATDGVGADAGADDEDSDSDDDKDSAPQKGSKCAPVWKGIVGKRAFKNFRFEQMLSEGMARKYLADKGVGQYWDMVRNYRDPTEDLL